jgi:single-strand DNA-binding protein
MGSYNSVTLLGRLGADPELKTTTSGKQVANLSVATDGGTKDAPRTEWTRVTCWDKTAEIAGKFLAKGREVLIHGRLQTRSWDDKDGTKKYATEVVCDRLVLVGKAPERTEREPGSDDDNESPI